MPGSSASTALATIPYRTFRNMFSFPPRYGALAAQRRQLSPYARSAASYKLRIFRQLVNISLAVLNEVSARSPGAACLRSGLRSARSAYRFSAARPLLGVEELLVAGREGVLFAVGLEHVVEVVGVRRVDGGLQGLAAGAADGTRRQTFVLVGVVRGVHLEVGEREFLPLLAQGVVDARVDLERHILADAVVDHRRHKRALLGPGSFLLDERGDGDELVLGEVQPLSGAGDVERLGLQEVLLEHARHHLRGSGPLLELVALGEKISLGRLYGGVLQEAVPVVRSLRRLLELRGGDVALSGHLPGGLLEAQALGDGDLERRHGLTRGELAEYCLALGATGEGILAGLYLGPVAADPRLHLEHKRARYDAGPLQFIGDAGERVAPHDLDGGGGWLLVLAAHGGVDQVYGAEDRDEEQDSKHGRARVRARLAPALGAAGPQRA